MNSPNTEFQYDSSYHRWRKRAAQSGLLFRALSQYYEDGLAQHGYTYSVDGTSVQVPVFISDAWTGAQIANMSLSTHDHTPISDETNAHLSEFVRPVAFADGQTPAHPDPDEYLWNGTIYGCQDISLSSAEFQLSPLTYYTAATRFYRLRDELYRSLYAAGVSPAETPPFSAHALQNTPRETIAPSLDELVTVETPLSAGGVAVCLVNTGAAYKLLVSRNSAAVTAGAGALDIVPSGFFEPDEAETPAFFTRHVLREFNEEVLGLSEDADSLDTETSAELQTLLDDGGASLQTVLSHINPVKGHLTISSTLIVDDPQFYKAHLADAGDGGWETDDIRLVSLSEAVHTALDSSHGGFKTNHVPAIVESVCYLDDQRSVSLPCRLRGASSQKS